MPQYQAGASMKTFLMCEPGYFEVSYVINPWMAANIGRVNQTLAARQWQNLFDTLAKKSHIKLIEPVAGLPDMVFTANAGLVNTHHDIAISSSNKMKLALSPSLSLPQREREPTNRPASPKIPEVIVSAFKHPERQGESQHYRKFFADAGYQVKKLPENIVFEGAGDALFDTTGELWLGSGPRSDAAAVNEIASALQVSINSLELIDPRWYHLDTAFCPLADGYTLAYKKAFSTASAELLQHKLGKKIIWVSDEDALNFACNAICLDHEIILYRASGDLKATLERYNFTVIEIDVSEFMKSGGSCKCMTLEI
jgi:N-dimethylarginine dimethylaminohydrolase